MGVWEIPGRSFWEIPASVNMGVWEIFWEICSRAPGSTRRRLIPAQQRPDRAAGLSWLGPATTRSRLVQRELTHPSAEKLRFATVACDRK